MHRFRIYDQAHLVSGAKGLALDWADLADRADEPADITAWQAHHAEVHARIYQSDLTFEAEDPA